MTTQISLIVSMYRTEKHLPMFLLSAQKMMDELITSGTSAELLLISNNTTDAEEILLSNLPQNTRLLKVGREPIYASWNRGVREAQGEFVTFWGVDDVRFSKAIIDALKNNRDADVIYFPFRYKRYVQVLGLKILAKVKTFMPPLFDKGRFMKEMHCGPHFMARRSFFDTVGYFDETFSIAGDFEWCARAAQKGAIFVRNTSVSGIFTNDGTTLSGSRNTLQQDENARVTKNL